MNIQTTERVFVTWPMTGVPVDSTIEIRINGGTWTTAAVDRPDTSTLRALVAGPEAPADATPVTATLAAGRNTWEIRVLDDPEVIAATGLFMVI